MRVAAMRGSAKPDNSSQAIQDANDEPALLTVRGN
jgi:hypothetical protein